MRTFPGILILICLAFASCQDGQRIPPANQTNPCSELDSLFATLHELDSALVNDAPWSFCEGVLKRSLGGLSHNQRKDNTDCNYLDQRYRPDELRLMFVETLRSRIVEDTIPEGLYYLLRMMGVFKTDPEISEFFAEEISYLATENPACYLGYLKQNPDQEVMLLHSTKWNTMDIDTLLARFSRLSDSSAVVNFLENLKDQKTDGI